MKMNNLFECSTQNIDGQATATTVSSRPDGPQHRSTTSNNNQESRRKVALTVQVLLFRLVFRLNIL